MNLSKINFPNMRLPNLNLYTRFFLLFSINTILLVTLIILGSFSISENEAEKIVSDRHEALYDMMAKLVQGPIDIESLKAEAKKNRVSIQINRGEETWRTGSTLPSSSELMTNAVALGKLYFTKVGSKYFIFTTSNNSTIAVTSQIANLIVYPNWLVLWPWLGVLMVLFISYKTLNSQLTPIRNAIHSASQISQGDLKYRIKSHPNNELGNLTKGLNKMAENLEELFASKNELLLSVSHELRSPMARMKVLLAFLEKGEIESKLNREINKMDAIVEQLLESERLRDSHKLLNLESYFFPNVMDDIMTSFDRNESIQLESNIPEIVVNIDLGRFKFLIRNLIENALKHNINSRPVIVTCQEGNNELAITIRDFGSGIDPEFLPRLFEPFSQAEHVENRSNNGVGLGLFLCKRIAIAHGGELFVNSELNKGSEFTFRLPVAA
ncbi:HAMP domain-containing histidine kinase [Thalassotalea sp. M1531]|uniref:histidine kinase n=1 Tax=Thalassotalea algicola TaxID=2716224 RepID=A0A7Y0L9W1_9GAMM|nr:HAMP domain-containing sensor histidine kinase [Thalassotalea algicola]NMP30654.1 HAMP domain-containing histidine kinase [Thalassotalea algicola]